MKKKSISKSKSKSKSREREYTHFGIKSAFIQNKKIITLENKRSKSKSESKSKSKSNSNSKSKSAKKLKKCVSKPSFGRTKKEFTRS